MTPPTKTTLDDDVANMRKVLPQVVAEIERRALAAQPAPPAEALRLLTAMVEHHDMMGMTPIMGHSCEAAREARRYLAATEEGT